MRILITNVQLDHRTGTEIVVRDLERGLRARGHEVCVYTPRPGILSDEITAGGGLVVTAIDQVPFVPDVVHGHHNGPATEAAVHFPLAPLVFVCHSRSSRLDMVRGVPSIREHVAVDLNCRERLIAEGVPADSIHVITNAVDINRFVIRSTVSAPPRKAAVYGNNASSAGGFVESVREACAQAGLTLDEFGSGVGRSLDDAERVLAEYDVVFAKARCAIEALAAGCAVLAIDEAGYGGLVTAAEVDWLLDWNVGDRCLQRTHDSEAILDDLRRLDADDTRRVSERVRERCGLQAALDAYERVYRAAVAGERAPSAQVAPSWQASQSALVEYATDLEARLRAGEGAWSMPPLPPTCAEGIAIAARAVPRRVAPGEAFSIEVEVTNRSRESLATIGATPVQLSYHWLDEATSRIVDFDGARTALTRSVPPGRDHRQRMLVNAPPDRGRLTLRVTLVQEAVAWFTNLPTPVFDDVSVVVADKRRQWRLSDISALDAIIPVRDAVILNLGFVSSPLLGLMTYAETPTIIEIAVDNGCRALIVTPPMARLVPENVGLIESDVPGDTFRRLHGLLADGTDFYGDDEPSRVHPRARVHPTATIDDRNVHIEAGVEVGAACVISGRVTIGRRAVISPGAVIGAAGFQTMLVDGRPTELVHVGGVHIGEGAIVFANATIARGLFRQDTVVGESCRIGNNAFVSHNTQLGSRSVVGHGAIVNGNVRVGAGVWIGPGACIANNLTIGDGARVDLGATVIGSVAAGEHVGGPPAIDHRAVLREVAGWRARGRRR